MEDDALQRESMSRLIEDVDIEITAVEFGEQALELLRSTVFDCMIIDLKLPDMDGSELLERMAKEDICSFPPVIVYTGRNLTRDEEAALLKYSRLDHHQGARSPERACSTRSPCSRTRSSRHAAGAAEDAEKRAQPREGLRGPHDPRWWTTTCATSSP